MLLSQQPKKHSDPTCTTNLFYDWHFIILKNVLAISAKDTKPIVKLGFRAGKINSE